MLSITLFNHFHNFPKINADNFSIFRIEKAKDITKLNVPVCKQSLMIFDIYWQHNNLNDSAVKKPDWNGLFFLEAFAYGIRSNYFCLWAFEMFSLLTNVVCRWTFAGKKKV